ncbi:MAG: DUF2269 domain-containing protein [Steroidobacteraceae bacterium]
MTYLILKCLHIISSTILFGTGIGSAFYLLMANRSRDLASIRFATRYVVIADYIFTAPAVIVQPITGYALANLAGFELSAPWLAWAIVLYLLAGACWLPVVYLQIQMRDMAEQAYLSGQSLPPDYWVKSRWWQILGWIAFPAVIAIFYLMVFKPF